MGVWNQELIMQESELNNQEQLLVFIFSEEDFCRIDHIDNWFKQLMTIMTIQISN